jgi:hypothetical protein
MRRRGGFHLSKVNAGPLLFGLALVILVILGPNSKATIDASQLGPGASPNQRLGITAVGLLLIAWGVLTGFEPVKALWSGRGFLGAQPGLPAQLVQRPDRAKSITRALRQRPRSMAVVGIGGAGKSTLAAQACGQWRVRRRFKHGVTWLAAGPDAQPVALLTLLASRLGLAENSFTDVLGGRDALSAALRGKRVLIAVDNVWDRAPLDAMLGLGNDCTVLFTTRKRELASTIRAERVQVDELTQAQALALLGRWTKLPVTDLPPEARQLCTRVGNLALGVAMAGAMVARDHTFADVLTLIEQDLARVRADLDPEYQYATLRSAIEAGISILPADQRRHYEQLAVFASRGLFDRNAAQALWQPELTSADVGDLLADLTGWSLLSKAGGDWYTAHDLQYEVLKRRISVQDLAAAHGELVDGYKLRYPAGWASSITDPYIARALASHLHDAGRAEELYDLLTNTAWILARVHRGQVNDLVADYNGYASVSLTRHIGKALQLSAPVLAADPNEAIPQLVGRLAGSSAIGAGGWLSGLQLARNSGPTLTALTPALVPGFFRTEPETGQILSVAARDQIGIFTGGLDGRLLLWAPETGDLIGEIGSSSDPIVSLAVFEYGSRVLASSLGGALRIYRLSGTGRTEVTSSGPTVRSLVVLQNKIAVGCGDDQTLRAWDLKSLDEVRRMRIKTAVDMLAVAVFGPIILCACGDGTLRQWDLNSGKRGWTLSGHSGRVRCVAATEDGRRAVSGGDDGNLRLWDPRNGAVGKALQAHVGPVTSIAISDDGRWVVTAGADKSVRIWDMQSLREIAAWHGDHRIVGCVALPRSPIQVVVGQDRGRPYRLELRENPT